MYNKVLVPIALDHDISTETLEIARALTGGTGEVMALHVFDAPRGTAIAYLDEATIKQGFGKAQAQFDKMLAATGGIQGEVIEGHTYRTIIDYATSHGVDCIVIGSHKPGLSDFLLGSTAARVVRHAPCAVHVHRTS